MAIITTEQGHVYDEVFDTLTFDLFPEGRVMLAKNNEVNCLLLTPTPKFYPQDQSVFRLDDEGGLLIEGITIKRIDGDIGPHAAISPIIGVKYYGVFPLLDAHYKTYLNLNHLQAISFRVQDYANAHVKIILHVRRKRPLV